MIDERWQRLKDLFRDGAELPAPERAAFVARVAAGDRLLGDELASLLAADDSSASRLVRPLFERPEALLADGEPAELGPYRLIRPIGRGGVSTVHLAVRADDAYRQQVAVKLIQRGLDPQEMRRFHQERQILAGLNHPNIARLVDGGTTADGRPYLVMEHIEGWHIDEYCERYRLEPNERLHLFLAVADAVGFAHRNLVVHRDIKPSNVLVTADGVPKLLDFGIAKLLNASLSSSELVSTQPSLQRMTAGYASPEQVRGEPVTTVVDVYALGVLLYELLTGERPYRFPSRAPQDIARVICEVEPTPPSARARHRRLPDDLDAIVLKALAKEPRLRYGSVGELGADVERFLSHRPVEARRPSLGDRLAKMVRRNRLSAALVGLVVLFALAMSVQTLRLAGALELARAERSVAEREWTRGEEVTAFLIELFEVVDPSAGAGDEIPARAILDRGARRVKTELANQPRIQAEVLDTIGRVFQNLGLYDRAEPMLADALRLRREHLEPRHAEIADSLAHLAFLSFERSDFEAAEALGHEALEMRRELFGEAHPDVASSLHDLGELYRVQGRPDEAEALYREALAIRRARLGPFHRDVAESLAELGLLKTETGEAAAAEKLLREALAIWRAELGPAHHKLAMGLDYLAYALGAQGKNEAAESLFEDALAMQTELLGEAHPDVGLTLTDLGRLHYETGDLEAAEPLLRRALDIQQRLHGDRHPMVATAMNDLALVLSANGELATAEPLFKKALAIYRATLGEEHPAVPTVITNLARLYARRQDRELSESCFRDALLLNRRLYENPHPKIAFALFELGRLLSGEGAAGEAAALLAESLTMLEALEDPDERWVATVSAELRAARADASAAFKVKTARRPG